MIKKNQNILASRATVINYCERYKDFFSIYTDGSKQDDGSTGYGVYIPLTNDSIKVPLHPTYSVYLAEIEAIIAALKYIREYSKQNTQQYDFIIYSDSLSAIKSIQNFQTRPITKQIENILEEHKKITELNSKINIKIAWIPSHIGILGNEEADKLAKEATSITVINTQELVTLQDIYEIINKEILVRWQEIYTKTKHISHYKTIEPKVDYSVKFISKNLHKEGTITRLRLGNTYLNGYLFKTKHHSNGNCDHCNGCKETIAHFLLTCPYYNITKDITNPTLASILKDQIQIGIIYQQIVKIDRHL